MGSISSYETTIGKRYRVRYRKPDHSQTDKRGFRTKRDAEVFLTSVEVSKLRGAWVDPTRSRITVGEWAEQWYEAQLQLKATTLSGYRYTLDRHVIPTWGTVRLVDIGHADVQTWVTKLTKTLAASTVRQIFLVLAGLAKYAVRDGRLSRNPCEGVQLPRVVKEQRGYLSHAQLRQLADGCDEYGDVVLFLAYTGLRWGEMAALKVGRLDMLRSTVPRIPCRSTCPSVRRKAARRAGVPWARRRSAPQRERPAAQVRWRRQSLPERRPRVPSDEPPRPSPHRRESGRLIRCECQSGPADARPRQCSYDPGCLRRPLR
jgi:integrase